MKDLLIAFGVVVAILAGLLLADLGLGTLQEQSLMRPLPKYPLHPRVDFFVRSAKAAEPLCTCGPTCPTPVAAPWPIPASMQPVRR